MRPIKPLWGFGWMGWCLLPVAMWLAWAYVTGVDLRFKLLELINDVWGIKAVFWTVLNPCVHNWLTLDRVGLGWWGLLYVPVALHLHPRRSGWWWAPLAAWAALRPELYYRWAGRTGVGAMAPVVAASHGVLDQHSAALLICCLVDVTMLGAMTRSRWVFIATAVATALGVTGERVLNARMVPTPVIVGQVPAYVWHGVVGGALLAWSIRARIKWVRPGHCRNCGYDLRGLTEARCPECGGAFTVEPPADAGAPGTGLHSPL